MAGRLAGKVAIITGSGGAGLGRAGPRLFATEGARVVVLDVREAGIEETVRLIRDDGGEATGIRTDVTVPADLERMVEHTLGTFGKIDILWNNAAILSNPFTPSEEISLEDWNETFAVNITGVFLGVKAVVPHMKKQGSGAIVNTASTSALTVISPGYSHYAASKAAVAQYSRWLAGELGPFNIRVNCLAGGGVRGPGGVWKEGADFSRPEVSPFNGLPLGTVPVMPETEATRWPTPTEFAQGALYLVDPASGPITESFCPSTGE